jgi:hypothetical protein
VKRGEIALEREVSLVIGAMPFVWLPLEDEAGKESRRGYVESNSIALLSNRNKVVLDPPSREWLGRHCDRDKIRGSGLWNSNHVDENYDPAFLDELDRLASETATLDASKFSHYRAWFCGPSALMWFRRGRASPSGGIKKPPASAGHL